MRAFITKFNRCLAVLVVAGIFFAAVPITVSAATAKPAAAKTAEKEVPQDISGAVTQSYSADSSVRTAMIVQLKDIAGAKDKTKPTNTLTVIPLTSKNSENILGVVIPTSSATIVLSPQETDEQQVLVATSGKHNIIVSNQNGPIKIGDYISISAINGVGMKATGDQTQIVGRATAAFSGTSNVIGSVKVKDKLNKESVVSLGRILVDINITRNPLTQKTVDFVPAFLSGVAVTVADKPVSVARIYLCTAILLVSAFLAGNMFFSGIRGGMIAVGRNPLSKKSIIKSLIQTVMAGLIVFVVGIFAVYLLLKL